MDLSIADVERTILEAIRADALTLPTLPDVALRVKEVASKPETDINGLYRVICTDASVSARMLKVANSPAMRRSESEVTDLKVALTIMGTKYASNLALGVAMAQMFQSKKAVVDKHLKATWQLSSEVAGLSQAFCQFATGLEPSVGMLAGLVHRIGALPVLSFAEQNESLANDESLLVEAVEALHPYLGSQILRKWGFSDSVVDVCDQYLNFGRERETADYVDVVTVAVLENSGSTDQALVNVDRAKVGAYARLNMDPDSGGIGTVEISGTASDAAWAMG
ncbi:MAG: HDOD domain-containing protein [Pseudomonadales bacterium]